MSRFDCRLDRSGTGSLKWDRYADRDVLPFWVADMDFRASPEITDALQARLDHGVFGYTRPYPSLYKAVLDYLRNEQGVEAQEDWIVWLPGVVPALNVATRAFCRREEGVMICTPVYGPFFTAPKNQRRKLIQVPMKRMGDGRFTFDFYAMEHAITPHTRAFILCSPHNPLSRVFDREELDQLASFCAKHNLIIVSDEIHCDLVLEEGVRHTSTLALGPVVSDRTVTLMAPSKTYNVPGLGCAFAVIPNARLRTRFIAAMTGMLTEVNVFGYTACEAAYGRSQKWHAELIEYLRGNRNLISSFLAERVPEIKMTPCEATYLAWLDPSELHLEDPHSFFLDAGVGFSSGADFGQPGHLRMNFGCPREMLQEGLERIERAVQGLRAKQD